MQFIITRTSQWDHDLRPHTRAIQITKSELCHLYRDPETLPDNEIGISEIKAEYLADLNHHVIMEDPKRWEWHAPRTRWVIEIENLIELLNFVYENGDYIILNTNASLPYSGEIEIYDDYRE